MRPYSSIRFPNLKDLAEFLMHMARKYSTVHCAKHVAAVIDKRNRIVKIGYNRALPMNWISLEKKRDLSIEWKKRPKSKRGGVFTQHAEMDACSGIPRDVLRQCSLVVVRQKAPTKWFDSNCPEMEFSKPCPACLDWICSTGIRRIYHSA